MVFLVQVCKLFVNYYTLFFFSFFLFTKLNVNKGGCGKSTLLKVLLGKLFPKSGDVVVLGKAPGMCDYVCVCVITSLFTFIVIIIGTRGHSVPGSAVGYLTYYLFIYLYLLSLYLYLFIFIFYLLFLSFFLGEDVQRDAPHEAARYNDITIDETFQFHGKMQGMSSDQLSKRKKYLYF